MEERGEVSGSVLDVWIVCQFTLMRAELDQLVLVIESETLCNHNHVALIVLFHQLARRAEAGELSVDHDGDVVAELLGFVHAVSSQKQGRLIQLLEHLEQASPGEWIHPRSRLIKKLDSRAPHQRDSAHQLSLVAAAKVLGHCAGVL